MRFQFASIFFLIFLDKNRTRLDLSITGFDSKNGQICVAVFNSEATFLDEKKYFKLIRQPIENEKTTLDFPLGLPVGDYAISVFHDENGNGKLDKNWFGIPTEAYGFSQNFKAKWGKPSWAKTKFSIDETQKSIAIQLEKW